MSGLWVCGRVVVAAVVVGVWVGSAGWGQGPAQTKRPMTFADLMAMKRVSDPQISPSGRWVMFSVTDVSLEKNTKVNHLWVVPLDGSQKERQVTSNTGESFGRFSPNGQFVSYTGAPTKDDPVARITIATWDEKTGTIGIGRTLKAVSGDADGAVWSPDSRHFLFTTEVWPECSVKGGGTTKTNAGVLRFAQNDNQVEVVSGTREVEGAPPTHRDGAAMNGAPGFGGVPASWVEEDACDRTKDEAAEKSAVKGQVWEGLLYRHWDHYTGKKRTHVIEADFSMDGANPRDLTPATAVGDAETPTWMLGGPQEYAWAPDSKEIAYVTNLDAVPAASTNNDVFTLRLDEVGAKAVKVSTSPGSDDEPEYSPDGKWLAFRSQARAGFESDKFGLVLLNRATRTLETVDMRLYNPPTESYTGWIDEFVWSPDGAAIVFTSGIEGQEAVFAVDIQSGTVGGHPAFVRETFNGEYGDLRLVSAEHPVMMTALLVATRMAIDQPAEIVKISLPGLGHTIYTVSSDEKILGGTKGSDTYLTHTNDPDLSKLDLSKLEPFWFTGAEGTKVEGFLLRPPGFDPAKKYPVKFLMHGGPQTAWGDSWSYRWNWELMAASGYVVVGINRRGSTGYGQKFVDEVSGDWGGRAYVDLMRGLDYAEAHFPFIDKTRECALGASYGGFMADWVLTHTNRFQCIVTHDGMYDPVSAYGSTEEMWFNEWEFRRPEDFPKGWDGFGGGYEPLGGKADSSALLRNDKRGRNAGVLRSAQKDNSGDSLRDQKQRTVGSGKGTAGSNPTSDVKLSDMGHPDGRPAQPWRYASLAADEDPFRKWSPMRFIERAKTPTLVIHSQKDYRLDVSQGFELYTALQRLGVPSKMLYFPDEGHWILKPQNSELWYAEVGDWCDRWTHTGKYAEAAK